LAREMDGGGGCGGRFRREGGAMPFFKSDEEEAVPVG